MSKKSVIFGSFLRRYRDKPEVFRRRLKAGMGLEIFRRKHFAERNKSEFSNITNYLAVEEIYNALKANKSVWVNLFAPSEMLLAMGLNPLSAEGIAGVMTAMNLEEYPLSLAESYGITKSLCSFHRASVGSAYWGIFPSPMMTVTTTILCDGNPGSFGEMARKYNVPFYLIDVPRGRKKEYVPYVEKQLLELVGKLEDLTGKEFPRDKLSNILVKENSTINKLNEAKQLMKTKEIPIELFEQLNILYVLHTLAGDERLLNGVNQLVKDLENSPKKEGKRLLWMHIPPYFDNILFELFSPYGRFRVITEEYWWDWMYPLNPNNPIRSLAEKLVFNPEAGTVEDRALFNLKLARDLNIDGIIHFSHWGCRQSNGAAGYLKSFFSKNNIPFLNLDGDCVDHRNLHPEQLKTRIEAFFEMLED
ncbi:MAG: 2-hydroxyacyl-CoA dehydratase [Kosmotoga sp.]|nr:MAG: 2-hydroxyacyl-CoA dehydratase [Kosmotoga sp.]